MLEAGANIDPAKEFHHKFSYELDYRGQGEPGLMRRYSGSERNYRIMIDDVENPYTTSPETNYRWGRSRCLGGRTLHWARATDRMADYEFKAASRDGYGMDWAISYADMKPYYDRIESFVGVCGARENFAQFPDGVFLPPMPLNCAETIFTAASKSLGWPSTHRRLSQLTQPHNGRPACHYCGNCVNGCDAGAMFNPIAVTLPPALATGKLEIRTDSVVARVRMNAENRAQGVTYIERFTKKSVDVDAKWVILAASTLENTRLLLLSEKGGLANSSGLLGHYMMDQVGGGGVSGILPRLKGGPARLDDGKQAGITIPSFQNIDKKTQQKDFIRGYVMNATGGQTEFPQYAANLPGYGSEWKREVKSRFVAQARIWNAGAEMLARKENFVELDPEVKDAWGIPVLQDPFHAQRQRLQADRRFPAEGRRAVPEGRRGSDAGSRDAGGISRRRGIPRCASACPEPERAGESGGPFGDAGEPAAPSPARWIDPRVRHGAHERRSARRRAHVALPDARYPEPVRIRRQCVPVNRRQASDADDDGARRAWLRPPAARLTVS